MRHPIVRLACSLCLLCGSAAADELRLKDGGTLHGIIVGYEGESFKVETSYGYALVRKDKIAAIIRSDATIAPRVASKPEAKSPPDVEHQRQPKKAAPPVKEPISDIFAGMFKHHFSKDWSFAIGAKVWIHDWEAALPVLAEPITVTGAPNLSSPGLVAKLPSEGSEATLIPGASLRYKNLFVTASHYLDTEFDFPGITSVSNQFATPVKTTFSISAGRFEWDASLGYFLHPNVALLAGYKFLNLDSTERLTSSVATPEGDIPLGSFVVQIEQEISGPTVGLTVSVPIGRGFGVYGNFAYGFLVADSDSFLPGMRVDEDVDYILAESGFTYTPGTDYLPAWMPLSAATVYAGYRFQNFEFEFGSFGNFNNAEVRDVTEGFVVGANLTF